MNVDKEESLMYPRNSLLKWNKKKELSKQYKTQLTKQWEIAWRKCDWYEAKETLKSSWKKSSNRSNWAENI